MRSTCKYIDGSIEGAVIGTKFLQVGLVVGIDLIV